MNLEKHLIQLEVRREKGLVLSQFRFGGTEVYVRLSIYEKYPFHPNVGKEFLWVSPAPVNYPHYLNSPFVRVATTVDRELYFPVSYPSYLIALELERWFKKCFPPAEFRLLESSSTWTELVKRLSRRIPHHEVMRFLQEHVDYFFVVSSQSLYNFLRQRLTADPPTTASQNTTARKKAVVLI